MSKNLGSSAKKINLLRFLVTEIWPIKGTHYVNKTGSRIRVRALALVYPKYIFFIDFSIGKHIISKICKWCQSKNLIVLSENGIYSDFMRLVKFSDAICTLQELKSYKSLNASNKFEIIFLKACKNAR